ncbi:MAG: UDP-N-acetylglucosamine 2-epimerase [Alphaproteobacteria bacterium]|nr:UDP-N-acetylglucosamine 2-epimerase [Alphaproteobacteria bacterium]
MQRVGRAAHIMTVLGTRPEAIKMLPVAHALRGVGFRHSMVSTGQQRDLVAQVFAGFGTWPDIDLALMRERQTPNQILAAILTALPPLLSADRPDMLLVHGDTSTALAATLAAHHAGIPVGHVEAGLRSHDLLQPSPEEMNRVAIDAIAAWRFAPSEQAANRVAIDAIAAWRFAPSEQAAANLAREYGAGRVLVAGNTGIDALLAMAARTPPEAPPTRRRILVTVHRRESLGAPMQAIAEGLSRVAARGDVELLLPLHPNPAVRAALSGLAGARITEPLSYPEMVRAMLSAHHVITDSGGLQEEAPALGKPVLVLRNVTERPEAVATGVVRVIGHDPARIAAEAGLLLDDAAEYAARARPVFPYGDGRAALRIAAALREALA